jgi:hypothetical protein
MMSLMILAMYHGCPQRQSRLLMRFMDPTKKRMVMKMMAKMATQEEGKMTDEGEKMTTTGEEDGRVIMMRLMISIMM